MDADEVYTQHSSIAMTVTSDRPLALISVGSRGAAYLPNFVQCTLIIISTCFATVMQMMHANCPRKFSPQCLWQYSAFCASGLITSSPAFQPLFTVVLFVVCYIICSNQVLASVSTLGFLLLHTWCNMFLSAGSRQLKGFEPAKPLQGISVQVARPNSCYTHLLYTFRQLVEQLTRVQ